MSARLHRCVECPKCHVRYVMGLNPYSNGSHVVSDAAIASDLRKLFCVCCAPDYYEFKLSQLKVYEVPQSVYRRGYGSVHEIVLASDGQKRAS